MDPMVQSVLTSLAADLAKRVVGAAPSTRSKRSSLPNRGRPLWREPWKRRSPPKDFVGAESAEIVLNRIPSTFSTNVNYWN